MSDVAMILARAGVEIDGKLVNPGNHVHTE